MGRILAIDYGIKRTGLAVTDAERIIAGPLATVETPPGISGKGLAFSYHLVFGGNKIIDACGRKNFYKSTQNSSILQIFNILATG